MVIDTFFNATLGWSLHLSKEPRTAALIGIVFISFLITLLSTLVYKYFTDQNALKQIKEDNKKLQAQMKEHKGNVSKMAELQKEALQKGLIEPMKHQVKPLLITFIPFILIFGWLRATYESTGDIFLSFGWFGTYIIFSIVFSIVLRKLLKVE